MTFTAAQAVARIDPVWFRQALDNLIDNALRHTPAAGRVDVSASRQDGAILLVVDDTGPGFTATPAGGIFEPFAPAGRKQESKEPPTGLGLAVVRTIAEAHEGRVWAENVHRGRPGDHDHDRRMIPAGPDRHPLRARQRGTSPPGRSAMMVP